MVLQVGVVLSFFISNKKRKKKNKEKKNNSPLKWQNLSVEESRADMVKPLCLKDIYKTHIYSNREWHSSCCISLKIQIDLDIDVSYEDNQTSSPMDISTASTCLLSRLCALQGRAQHDPLIRAPAAPTRSPGSPRCASHQLCQHMACSQGRQFIITWCRLQMATSLVPMRSHPLQSVGSPLSCHGDVWSLRTPPRTWSGEVLSKVSYIKGVERQN